MLAAVPSHHLLSQPNLFCSPLVSFLLSRPGDGDLSMLMPQTPGSESLPPPIARAGKGGLVCCAKALEPNEPGLMLDQQHLLVWRRFSDSNPISITLVYCPATCSRIVLKEALAHRGCHLLH
eukprot:205271-Rhodomonas_salina.1